MSRTDLSWTFGNANNSPDLFLGAGRDCIDLHCLGTPEIIATVLLHGRQGVAIIDPGPSTTLPAR